MCFTDPFQHRLLSWLGDHFWICRPTLDNVMWIFIFLVAISPRPPSQSSPNLLRRWHLGCNRKVKLLVSELFGGGMEIQKGHICVWRTQLHRWRQNKNTYQKSKAAWFGRIISLPNAENCVIICRRTADILWCTLRSDAWTIAHVDLYSGLLTKWKWSS